MTETPTIERPARRFLHICYSCADDTAVADFFVRGLDLQLVMRTSDVYSPGSILGLEGQVRSPASFVYDSRGPRRSPAIEIQGWVDPEPVGMPSTDPNEVGIKALGFAVPSIDRALERLTALGCSVVADGKNPEALRQVAVRDPRDVTLDLVEDGDLDPGQTRLHHLRETVSDLEASIAFFDSLGFELVGRTEFADGSHLGAPARCAGEVARLRLPDEPMELQLFAWTEPAAFGSHYAEPFHAGLYRAALGVDDTRASHAHLVAAGARFDRPPMEVELSGTPVPDMWITFISDPDGVPYEFVQRPRAAFR